MTDTSTRRELRPPSGAWLRIMALVYDPFVWMGELAGMRQRRRTLVSGARGSVLEIGAGTGLNVGHYPDGVDELVLAEPEPAMRRRLARRVRQHDRAARIVDASAERLPLPDQSVDTVVSTLVLCTVTDPECALREIARVLRPGGQFLFIEHVRAKSSRLARWQDHLFVAWRGFAGGCCCNRPIGDMIRGCGFDLVADDAVWRGMPRIVHPLIVGHATPDLL